MRVCALTTESMRLQIGKRYLRKALAVNLHPPGRGGQALTWAVKPCVVWKPSPLGDGERHMAMRLLKQEDSAKYRFHAKRFLDVWDKDHLLKALPPGMPSPRKVGLLCPIGVLFTV